MEVVFDCKGNAAVHSHREFPKHFDKIISLQRDFSIADTFPQAQVAVLAELRPCSQAQGHSLCPQVPLRPSR